MIAFYLQIKWVHIVAVLCSGSLFALRGSMMLAGSSFATAAPIRFLSYTIDTVLLTAALMLATMLPSAVFANGWLAMKLVLLVIYIVLGTFALKRGRTHRQRTACFFGAMAVFAFMLSIARAHHPLGILAVLVQ